MDIKITIIMPVYNAKNYLTETIESVLNQSFIEFELIAINDGSTDNSLEILKSYSKIDKRIIVLEQENRGVSKTRNRGINLAKGKYISFLDADDLLEKDFLKTLYKLLEKGKTDIAITGYSPFYNKPKTKVLKYTNRNLVFNNSNKDNWFSDLLDCGLGINIWNKLYKKEMLDKFKIRFDEELSYGEDIFFCWKAILAANSISFDNFSRYYYRLSSSSASMKYHSDLYEKYKVGFNEVVNFAIEHDMYSNKIDEDIYYYFFRRLPALLTMIIRSNNNLKEKKQLIKNVTDQKEIKIGQEIFNKIHKNNSVWYSTINVNKLNRYLLKIYIYNFKNKYARKIKKLF